MKTNILFLLPYPLNKAPSQRFRIECYFELLKENGIYFEHHSFFNDTGWQILYQGGSSIKKLIAVCNGFMGRLFCILRAGKYDFIVIHREAAPLGPPVIEWILAKILRKKLIYDFDDAIWIPAITETNKIARYLKCFWKVGYICKWSWKISAGNKFLSSWAEKYSRQVKLNPTCVDMDKKFNQVKEQHTSKVTIGWTGSHSTLKYLNIIYPVLQELEKEREFEFIVICNKPPEFRLTSLRFIKWQEVSEIEDLLQMNIGIMPLIEDAWSEGKCGFKLIQYLSLGIPAVASPIGVNKQIIEDGINGRLCSTSEEWKKALTELLDDAELRMQLGTRGLVKMNQQYSIQANAKNFISLFS
ncbi:MAG TPA: glycosyltransferase [Flavisolibacter sp.]|nr:glycosyltransferase [Flavisolibacter sp.]